MWVEPSFLTSLKFDLVGPAGSGQDWMIATFFFFFLFADEKQTGLGSRRGRFRSKIQNREVGAERGPAAPERLGRFRMVADAEALGNVFQNPGGPAADSSRKWTGAKGRQKKIFGPGPTSSCGWR